MQKYWVLAHYSLDKACTCIPASSTGVLLVAHLSRFPKRVWIVHQGEAKIHHPSILTEMESIFPASRTQRLCQCHWIHSTRCWVSRYKCTTWWYFAGCGTLLFFFFFFPYVVCLSAVLYFCSKISFTHPHLFCLLFIHPSRFICLHLTVASIWRVCVINIFSVFASWWSFWHFLKSSVMLQFSKVR